MLALEMGVVAFEKCVFALDYNEEGRLRVKEGRVCVRGTSLC